MAAAAAAAAMAGHFNEHGYHYLRDIGNLVAQALDPLGVDVQVTFQKVKKMFRVCDDNSCTIQNL